MSCEDVDNFNQNFYDFKYPDGETALTASFLPHDDDNPALVRNKQAKYYTLSAQVLAQIVFNILPKLGEYSHAKGYAPLLIYWLLKGIRATFPFLIIDFMLFEHLLIPNRNLPFGMILICLFKHLKIDLFGEIALAPSIYINNTLLKRMQASSRVHASPHPVQPQARFVSGSTSSADQYTALMNQIGDLSLKFTSANEKILANQNDLR